MRDLCCGIAARSCEPSSARWLRVPPGREPYRRPDRWTAARNERQSKREHRPIVRAN